MTCDLTIMEKQIVGSLFGSANIRSDIPKLLKLYREGQLDLDAMITTPTSSGTSTRATRTCGTARTSAASWSTTTEERGGSGGRAVVVAQMSLQRSQISSGTTPARTESSRTPCNRGAVPMPTPRRRRSPAGPASLRRPSGRPARQHEGGHREGDAHPLGEALGWARYRPFRHPGASA